MRLPEDDIVVLEKIIQNLPAERGREICVFQSCIDHLQELQDLRVLQARTGWLKLDDWKRQNLQTMKCTCVDIVYKGRKSQAWYFPKRDAFYWNHGGNGIAAMSECINWVRDI